MAKQTHSLRWRQNGRDSVSNHQPHDCLLNRLFRRRSKKTSKLRVTGLCAGNSPGTGEFPAQMASYAENVSIWWRHHVDTKPAYVWHSYLRFSATMPKVMLYPSVLLHICIFTHLRDKKYQDSKKVFAKFQHLLCILFFIIHDDSCSL